MPARTAQREALLQTIEKKPHLDNRFEGMQRVDEDGGGGQFSLVVCAKDRHTGKKVALKFFDPDWRRDAYRWESFKREAELLPKFQGKPDILQCICPLTEFQEPFRNTLGVVFQIDFAYYGAELADFDVNAGIVGNRWNAEQKLEVFRCLCRAVQRMHGAAMAHRDLKPSNGLMMPDGSFRLSDFGTARIVLGSPALLPAYGGPPGDLGYSAPEMFAALHDVDASIAFRSDMYALGAILFELFSGANLNLQILDAPTIVMLQTTMNRVAPDKRIRTYQGFIGSFSAARPLPSLGFFGSQAPPSIIDLLDRLYMGLAAIDYLDRIDSFESVFVQINRCMFVLRHEAAYQRWREQKRRRRAKSTYSS